MEQSKTNSKYIDGLKRIQCSINEIEYKGGYISYSRLLMQKKGQIKDVFLVDFYTEIPHKNTIRGMYYQTPPYEQAMLISCGSGRAIVFAIDIRNDSPTYLKKNLFTIGGADTERTYLYLPRGVAYGYITLEDNTQIDIKFDNYLEPENEVIFNIADPMFDWHLPKTEELDAVSLSDLIKQGSVVISAKDKYAQWFSEYEAKEMLE